MIRATVRLSPNERRKRNSGALSISEIADQLKNVEKWRNLTEIARVVLETVSPR